MGLANGQIFASKLLALAKSLNVIWPGQKLKHTLEKLATTTDVKRGK